MEDFKLFQYFLYLSNGVPRNEIPAHATPAMWASATLLRGNVKANYAFVVRSKLQPAPVH